MIAEAISLILTFTAMQVFFHTCYRWRMQIIEFLKGARESISWIGAGIFIGFTGSFLDNFYWGLAWSADYAQHPARDWLFRNGVYPNIPFRQVAGTVAGYFHLRGAMLYFNEPIGPLHRNILISTLIGCGYVWLIS